MLESIWNLLTGLLSSIWILLATVLTFVGDIIVWLHVENPRLEGLLIGVLLAWLLNRRESHPLLRVLSAPLKLVLDILDLAWDQVQEVTSDLWDTGKGWGVGSYDWVTNKFKSAYGALMGKLKSTKKNLQDEEK